MTQLQSDGHVVVRVTSDRYADDHPGWVRHVDQLRSRLGDVARPETADSVPLLVETGTTEPDTGTKGLIEAAALVVASSQMIRAVALVIREWQKQDASRSVSIEVKSAGNTVKATGKGRAGIEAVQRALQAALEEERDQQALDQR